jgi:hypothetical protein
MEKHPADESKISVVLNVMVPALAAIGIFVLSLAADLAGTPGNWTQRSGTVLIVVGAYIGYHEARKALQFIGDDIYFNPELWYKVLAIALVVVGTVVSGYGDLIIRVVA